jgi:hypothetical protein
MSVLTISSAAHGRKYEKKIGSIRKKYVMEDRQRLLDTIERFTPTYKAVIKNMGQDATDEGGNLGHGLNAVLS